MNSGETSNYIDLLAGNDTLQGSSDPDISYAGDGNDLLYGYNGDDALIGENGDDTLDGGSGTDLLYGGSGNDFIFGGAGNDNMLGGAGNDYYVHVAGEGLDVLNDNKSGGGSVGVGGVSDTVYLGFKYADISYPHQAGSNDLLLGTTSDLADGVLTDGVRIEDFYSSAANKIEYVRTSDNYLINISSLP